MNYTNEAVLSQIIDGKWRPVAFQSCALNKVERNYEIYNKEMMGIMDSIEDWRQYLLGAKDTVEVFTNHQNLQYFKKPQKLNQRQARWVTKLYDIQMIHKPGRMMGKADALSRMTGLEKGKKDNDNIVGHRRKLHDGISPPGKWANRTVELRDRAFFTVIG